MIYQGEDKALDITITDSSGALVSIDGLLELIVYIYSSRSSAPLLKFNKAGSTGYTALLRVTSTKYTAILPKSITSQYASGSLLVEVELQQTDARFASSVSRTKGVGTIDQVTLSTITE